MEKHLEEQKKKRTNASEKAKKQVHDQKKR
jgi:hypothetical protein